jgi:hypothetical protein
MTLDELYNHITHYVAHPHTAITEHDKRRAILILNVLDEYFTDSFGEVYWDKDGPFEDFGDYASKQLDILEGKNK